MELMKKYSKYIEETFYAEDKHDNGKLKKSHIKVIFLVNQVWNVRNAIKY
jgi:hypothetical protein